jgi:hypothetical protein
MTKTFTATVHIDASADQVWAVLTDFDGYAAWNPFIISAKGAPVPGDRLVLRMQPVGGSATTLRPRLVEVTASRRLRWLGRLGVPGLFDAEHDFILRPQGSGTELTQREVFRGALVPLFARMLDRSTLPAFVAMNTALKVKVEEQAAARV